MGLNWKPLASAALTGAGAMMLSGCLLTAGTFDSELAVMKGGNFSYRYDGEIQMLALSNLAELGAKTEDTFEPSDCYTDDFETRDCTADEIAEQKADWDAGAAERTAKKQRDAETAKVLMGGIDPTNPEAGRQIAARLERQKGWNKVTYIGNGLFDVNFAISGQLTHDFAFPVMEQVPMSNAFVTVIVRDGGQVRIDAPAFVVQDSTDPMRGMMAGMIGLANLEKQKEGEIEPGDEIEPTPRVVVPQGRFVIVTDGTILANNTDEGPTTHARGQQLTWSINGQSKQAPMALISIGN